jgi:hypothetical protein
VGLQWQRGKVEGEASMARRLGEETQELCTGMWGVHQQARLDQGAQEVAGSILHPQGYPRSLVDELPGCP